MVPDETCLGQPPERHRDLTPLLTEHLDQIGSRLCLADEQEHQQSLVEIPRGVDDAAQLRREAVCVHLLGP